jgi:hypothetical protein
MILPCIVLTFVSLLAFLVPVDSGEKINLSITILLSMIGNFLFFQKFS